MVKAKTSSTAQVVVDVIGKNNTQMLPPYPLGTSDELLPCTAGCCIGDVKGRVISCGKPHLLGG